LGGADGDAGSFGVTLPFRSTSTVMPDFLGTGGLFTAGFFGIGAGLGSWAGALPCSEAVEMLENGRPGGAGSLLLGGALPSKRPARSAMRGTIPLRGLVGGPGILLSEAALLLALGAGTDMLLSGGALSVLLAAAAEAAVAPAARRASCCGSNSSGI
jgi:hypothetical protein